MMTSRIVLVALAGGMLTGTVFTGTAHAQSSGDPVDAVLACRQIADIEARLACFDTAAANLAQARDTGDLVTVTRDDVEAVERDSFGFSMPSLPRFSMPAFGRRDRMAEATNDALEGVADTAIEDRSTEVDVAEAPDASGTAPQPAAQPAAPQPAAQPAAVPESAEVEILSRNDDGEVHSVRMRIARTRVVGYNTTIFYMENGQVWRQLDDRRVRMPRGDDNWAEIRRGAMGSYLLRVNGEGRAIAVRRQE